ncbi:YggS family pyridoxal phosphate-dependent enzyme [Thiopseudomonas alkaliphila]|uniref:YggS family pyridoxal phosphate-dependent enzyme n=1 Tax=Thiopseudomonas alkaliphila TaxID=1697053 RepID=UPI002577D8FA|nr:YggS family pyridoxal phosphate-dependent enzyme [Thiopseudomonas alkaliphila]MDM1708532.1 YggS family pyridoxal phosphate-dependent enzyme [Thiopseudomonas alkaliphila]
MSTKLAQNFQQVTQRLVDAHLAYAAERPEPQLLAVSKHHSTQAIAELYHLGQRAFAESYLQEALLKQQALSDLPIEWHFIGPIQSNKAKQIAQHFSWVHSVDRLKVAQRLSEACVASGRTLNICLQVNISREPSKSGCLPEELPALASAVQALPQLQLRGLMAIPQPTEEVAEQRANFAKVAALQVQLSQLLLRPLDTLSMGMSNDLEAAVAEGASYVRIGTALFGARN